LSAPVWRSDSGRVIACVEKIKVLNENIEELAQIAQDALEDGLLMGCSEVQLRQAFHDLIDRLTNPYAVPHRNPVNQEA
jgi:hypothetical protein